MTEHKPGCGIGRGRPCICTYLQSWKPERTRVIPVTRMFAAPIGTPADCFWEHAYQVPTSGNITVEWTVEDVNLETFALLSGHPVHTLIDTPQNRDERRRAGLETMDTVRERIRIQRQEVIREMAAEQEKAKAERAREMQDRVNKADPRNSSNMADRLRYWRDTATFYRHAAMTFALMFLATATVSTGRMLGWW